MAARHIDPPRHSDAHGRPGDAHGRPGDAHGRPGDAHGRPGDAHGRPAGVPGRHAGETRPKLSGRWILLPVVFAAFIIGLDNTVVNVSAPAIQRHLRMSMSGLEWVASGYILAFASLLLLGGRLTDIYGRHRIFFWGIGSFGALSAVAGISPDGGALIAARVVQGATAAMVMPSTLAILSADVDEDDRHLGTGLWTASLASALALGPVVGGFVTEHFGWRTIFFLNVPIVLSTLLIAAMTMPGRGPRHGSEPAPQHVPTSMDWPGVITSTASLTAAAYALVGGHAAGYASPLILGCIVGFVVFGAAFIVVERRSVEPMVDVQLFRNRVFFGGTVAQVLWGLGVNGVFFFTALFLQNVLHYSPTRSGLTFLPLAGILLVVVPLVPTLIRLIGDRGVVGVGMLLVAAGLFDVSLVNEHVHFLRLLPGLLLIGIGSAMTTPLTSSVLAVVPPGREGLASALVSAAREVSGVLGIAVTGAIVAARGGDAAHIAGAGVEPFVHGYSSGIQVASALVLVGGAVGFVTLPARARRVPSPVLAVEAAMVPVGAGISASRQINTVTSSDITGSATTSSAITSSAITGRATPLNTGLP